MFCHLLLEFSSFVPVSVRAYKQRIRRCEKIAIKGKKETSKEKKKTKQNKTNDTQEQRIYLQYLLYQLVSTYIVALISENGLFSFNSHNIMVQYFAVFFFFLLLLLFFFFLNSKLGNNLDWSC